MAFDEYYRLRRELMDAVGKDLIGPSSEDEVIFDRPLTHYISGILYPLSKDAQQTIDPEQNIDIPDDDVDDKATIADPPIALANVRYPSSMGMSFSVDSQVTSKITLQIQAAKYIPAESRLQSTESDNAIGESDKAPIRKEERWRRIPIQADPVELDITKPDPGKKVLLSTDDLILYYRIRPANENNVVSVTVVILNNNEVLSFHESRDVKAIFQPVIQATVPGTTKGAFVERSGAGLIGSDEDIKSYRLLYRHVKEFAIGHGCSTSWKTAPNSTERALTIETTYCPEFDLKLMDNNPEIDVRSLEMLFLEQSNREDICRDLDSFCVGYENWIQDHRKELGRSRDLDKEQIETAKEHLDTCDEALGRMRRGVALIEEGDEHANHIWKAFRWMNSAMLEQRARTVWLESGRPGTGPERSPKHRWYPFQLAFILLCLEGIANPNSADRKLADLLWFPTGGGKTEAYLGLIAFTVFLRRLRNADGGGVTALMRYTLRLLTVQQFERAALFTCCCESIRQDNPELGEEHISIGLWLGKDATPNTRGDAAKALDLLRAGSILQKGDPVQLHVCPWCGQPINHRHYVIGTNPPRMIVSCRQSGCRFGDALPVYLIDEDIYDYRPTLIIATVDKFASLPWLERAGEIFNREMDGRREQPPPELIIQDELHLISGPLGTIVGLYETAVDAICSLSETPPKIIASTATIRRARQQMRGLFNREVRQFPVPGLDVRNSYFSTEASLQEKGTRMYLGLMTSGTSPTTGMIRAYAALLQHIYESTAPDSVKDPYWTLVGYFNALRVLGAAVLQVQDDVSDSRIKLLAKRNGTQPRVIGPVTELTSNKSSSEIRSYLDQMKISYPGDGGQPLDVILATNMISVGVDIGRFGLMVVMGQPQSTSEYIQSTSRVGRRFPGLVVVLLNVARSRDRSHYESFVPYHSALYRQVESTSVTPFSARARDRGLHAALVAMVRIMIPEMRKNASASKINDHATTVEDLIRQIVDRVRQVATDEEADDTQTHLKQLLEEWKNMAMQRELVYRPTPKNRHSLLKDAAEVGLDPEEGFAAQWSMRDVDSKSNLYFSSR